MITEIEILRHTSAQPIRWIDSLGSSSACISAWLRSISDSRAPFSFFKYDCVAIDSLSKMDGISITGEAIIGFSRGAECGVVKETQITIEWREQIGERYGSRMKDDKFRI